MRHVRQYIDKCNQNTFTEEVAMDFEIKKPLSYNHLHNVMLDNKYGLFTNTSKKCTGKYIYLGWWLRVWGHCITDNLATLWFLRTEQCKQLQAQGYKLCCKFWDKENKGFFQNFIDLLRLLDIDARDITIIKDDFYFSDVVVPELSFEQKNGYRYWSKEFKETIGIIMDQIPCKKGLPEKVYFSRTHLNEKGRDFGEKHIEEVFRELGYEIIYPETMDLTNQLTVLKACKSFAATQGSISHNSIFCMNGTECIVIKKFTKFISYQHAINQMKKTKSIYVDAHLTLFFVAKIFSGPFYMYINRNMLQFVQDRGGKILN